MYDVPERKRIVLGITGSIAAYKSAELARMLVSWGYEVRVVMTEAAQQFITPLTMQTITQQRVMREFWEDDTANIQHIEWADWADALVIAPATADFIAKLAAGFAESPLLAIALATKAPVLVAPAMNVNMLEHPATRQNIETLRTRGVRFVDPEEGELACGWVGSGRLADPWEIFYATRRIVSKQDLHGKRILIATGPTREPIDPVRFISNRSSGKMGIALAREAFRRGADVTVVQGQGVRSRAPKEVALVQVETAEEMRSAVIDRVFPKDAASAPDIVIMAAAVADYRPAEVASQKIKKSDNPAPLKLLKNADILHEIGKKRGDTRRPVLIGFAVETGEIEDLLTQARTKLEQKNADLIVGNFASDAFDLDTNRVWLVDRNGRQEEVATTHKSRVSNKILDRILKL